MTGMLSRNSIYQSIEILFDFFLVSNSVLLHIGNILLDLNSALFVTQTPLQSPFDLNEPCHEIMVLCVLRKLILLKAYAATQWG